MADFEIGTTLETMTNIEALTPALSVPRAPFRDFADRVTASSGRVFGRGFPFCRWLFSRLTGAQREELKSFCAGESANVYIKTLANDDVYHVYQAVMVWPQGEEREPAVRDRMELEILFTHLVEIPEEEE